MNRTNGARTRLLLGGVLTVLILNAWLLFVNFRNVSAQEFWVTHTFEVFDQLNQTLSDTRAAESNVRAYLIDRSPRGLEYFGRNSQSVMGHVHSVLSLTADNPIQQGYGLELENAVTNRMNVLRGITLGKRDRATEALATDYALIDRIRLLVERMKSAETDLLRWREENSDRSKVFFYLALGSTSLISLLIVLFAFFQFRKNHLQALKEADESAAEALEKQTIATIAEKVAGDLSLERAGTAVLDFLADHFGVLAAKLYILDAGRPRAVSFHACTDTDGDAGPRGNLVSEALRRRELWSIADVPSDYWKVTSGLGQDEPRLLVFLPLRFQGLTIGVIEMALWTELSPLRAELLRKVAETIGVGLNAAQSRYHLQLLLEKTQQQSEELQAQQEELRVSNEELSEQTRALKEAQSGLENQRAELEQTNDQLEEQTRMLEHQKDDLKDKNDALSAAQERLETSSRYKSEFLANMSHELRTPLNSTLILSKLLADNVKGNLTDEQVEFARTIGAAGTDLLDLINDILDLSKVEAGKLEIHPEKVWISKLSSGLDGMLRPIAQSKGLSFKVIVEPEVPEWLETDRQRIEQVLKNLLSNALKFTERGGVELRVRPTPNRPGFLSFEVSDTGIGIPAEQQGVIFEAFRQADGTTNRKYGGTGLGLSISRDLSHLLGGEIIVESEVGKGSTFTALFPQELRLAPLGANARETREASRAVAPAPVSSPSAKASASENSEPAHPNSLFPDDRDARDPALRTILVMEDEAAFARILFDLAHEMNFNCIVTPSAEAGMELAVQIVPDAIVLDMKLLDHSGLWALDRLKETPKTRHIPVHILSSEDYSQAALQMGAIGYKLKPVKRDELRETFRKLEATFLQKLKKILVVEDDRVQREAIQKLIADPEIEIILAGRGDEALAQLTTGTFDCMIVDLSLPDMTGGELLEKMTKTDLASFPPVIVYTGRSLTRDEEDQLRKYSRSIILKGARSPERLLSEVGLFLHRVEAKMSPDKQRMMLESRNREKVFEGRTILVVDDDVRNIFALSAALEPKGAKIEIARNGREAIEKLEASGAIDLVLMDVMMPEMDGYEAMRRIRRETRFAKLPIIAVTARAMRDDQERCIEAGANDYLAKPIDIAKLSSLIRVWMPTGNGL